MTFLTFNRRVIAALSVVFLAFGCAAGCGWFEDKAKAVAIAVGALGQDPFSSTNFGEDVNGLQPGPNGGVRDGQLAGLYGGTLNKSSCDKSALIRFLTGKGNGPKAAAWAGVRGIRVKDIPAHIKKLTPVLLRNDTRVRNHGFRKGLATVFEALLEAGIAVLVDDFGQPVVKCNCGNPLSEPIKGVDDFKVDIPDKEWQRKYSKKKVTVVKPNRGKRVRRFYLADVAGGKGIGRPAGTDSTRDVKLAAPPAPPAASRSAKSAPAVAGTWRATSYSSSLIRVSEAGDGAYTGAIARDLKLTGTCVARAGRIIWRMRGTGSHFTGSLSPVDANSCADAPGQPAVWDLTGNTLKMCFSINQRQQCETWERTG